MIMRILLGSALVGGQGGCRTGQGEQWGCAPSLLRPQAAMQGVLKAGDPLELPSRGRRAGPLCSHISWSQPSQQLEESLLFLKGHVSNAACCKRNLTSLCLSFLICK